MAFPSATASVSPGTQLFDIDWRFSGTMPGTGGGDNTADFKLVWGTGGHVHYLVTPLASSGAPTLESMTLASGQDALCRTYYESALNTYTQSGGSINWSYRDYAPTYPYARTHVPSNAGQTIESLDAGNDAPSILGFDRDGKW